MKIGKIAPIAGPRKLLRRWRDFRERQLEELRESNRPHLGAPPPLAPESPRAAGPGARPTDAAQPTEDSPGPGPGPAPADSDTAAHGDPAAAGIPASGPADGAEAALVSRYGEAGRPLNRHSPFYIGFVGALGALAAIALWNAFGQLATTLTILIVSLFLTLALNPLVEALTRRGTRRGGAVTLVFLGVLVVFTLIGILVIPPVVTQGADLIARAPTYLQHLLDASWVQQLDRDYGVLAKAQSELTKKLTDQAFLEQVLGGILGAGKLVASGIFQTLTVLILTLYFLASLPAMKTAAYAMVPASRRPRIVSLSEEMMRRVGSYAIGQVAIAAVNAACSWVMMTILGLPYAAVLAVAVGLLGLIPLVGATLGAAVVSAVAFFDEPRLAIVTIIYYVVYQQIENYVFMPRIMKRTVSVPGAVTVVAALAGGILLGMLGALLAIPFAAALLLLYDEVLVPRQRQS